MKINRSSIDISLLALLILTIAASLRFYRLDALSLWTDELFSLATISLVGEGTHWYSYVPKYIVQLQLDDSFLTWKAAEHSPPLSEALLWCWINLFGTSDFAIRSLSATVGSLAPLVMFFGLRVPLGTFAAFVGAVILALMPEAVHYSQEVRAYSLLILFSTIATVRLIQYITEKNDGSYQIRPKWWGHYGFDVAIYTLMSYTHYTGLILSFAYICVRVVSAWLGRRKNESFWIYFLVPLLLSPWIYLNAHTMFATNTGAMGWRDYSVREIWDVMIPGLVGSILPGSYAFFAFFVLFARSGFLSVTELASTPASVRSWFADTRTLLVCAFSLILLLQFGHSIYTAFGARVWHPRYFLVSLPMCAAIFALFASQSGRFKYWVMTLTLTICALCAQSIATRFSTDKTEDYRGATQYIVDRSRSQPIVATTWRPNAAYYLHYLNKLMGEKNIKFEYQPVQSTDDLIGLCKKTQVDPSRQLFFLYYYSHKNIVDEFKSLCAESVVLVAEQGFWGLVASEFKVPVTN